MAIIKRKARQRIGKQVRKLVKKHGPEVALGAATALVKAIVTKGTDKPAKKGKGKKEKPSKKSEVKNGDGKKTKDDKKNKKVEPVKSAVTKKIKKAAPAA